jgi:hypothetical protein
VSRAAATPTLSVTATPSSLAEPGFQTPILSRQRRFAVAGIATLATTLGGIISGLTAAATETSDAADAAREMEDQLRILRHHEELVYQLVGEILPNFQRDAAAGTISYTGRNGVQVTIRMH